MPFLEPLVPRTRGGRHPLAAALPLAALLLAGGSPVALGQERAHRGQEREEGRARVDSAAIEAAVLDAARDFERFRRRRFPRVSGSGSGRCDERVGRYCLFHEDGSWEPPPERADVAARREELLDSLDAAARALPGSRAVAGRRVWYLIEAGRDGRAVEAARACRAGSGWCGLLEGLALHEDGRFVESEDVFGRTLAVLPAGERRELASPGTLLEGEARDRWEEADPARRAELEDRLWWLSDPLWLVAGSERRTEHLARGVAALLHRDAEGPYGRRWDDGLEELLVRYGWPVGWERERVPVYRRGVREPIVAHHGPHAPRTVPSEEALLEPSRASPDAWELYPDAPRSTYRPAYLDTLALPAAHRTSRFERRDSLVLVAAWRTGWAPSDRGDGDGRVETLFRLDEGPGRTLGEARTEANAGTGRLVLRAPRRPGVLSLEVLDREGHRALRVRRGLSPPERPEGVPGVSDLLPVEPEGWQVGPARTGGAPPLTAPEPVAAMARALPPGPRAPGERVGLYWELYGPARLFRGAALALELERRGGGFFRNLAEGLGLVDDRGRRVAAGWRLAPEPGRRVHPSGVVLTLPTELEEGDYRLRLEVRVRGYEPLSAELPLEVRAP